MPDPKLPIAPEGYEASDTLPEVPDDREAPLKAEVVDKDGKCQSGVWNFFGIPKNTLKDKPPVMDRKTGL